METGSASGLNAIIARAKAIILKPKDEWPVIASESGTPGDIFVRYALPLAAIGPASSFLGGQIFGFGAMGFSYRPSLLGGLSTAVFSFIMGLVGLVVLTFIADFLAPKFGGESNRTNAFKLVAYGMTAGWLAGIFGLIPSLGFFGLLGLYSLYLLYTGSTPMMKVPEDKAVGYTAVTLVCGAALYLLAGLITAPVMGLFGGTMLTSGAMSGDDGEISGKITLPGGGTIDVDKAKEASEKMEAAVNGKSPPVPMAKLQELLPTSIGSYQRTAVEASGAGAMGSQAEGTYGSGDKSFHLKVIDMSALGALAGIGAATGVEQSREDADGYEKTGVVDGQMRSEKWNRSSSSGKYSVVVGNRFMIEADGNAGSIDELKAAVAKVDQAALAGLVE
jgi:hypothetical protein